MKTAFALALLVVAVAYTAYGLSTLTLLTAQGRPAAGFFPLLIGILLTVGCTANLWGERRTSLARRAPREAPTEAVDPKTQTEDGGRAHSIDVALVFFYLVGLVAMLRPLGALPAMIVFMLVFLFTFNARKPITNIVYALTLPGLLYLLFKVLLNASLPIGPLGI